MEHKKRIIKSTLLVSIATSISRVFGYVRDVCLAIVLGAGFGMDVFTIAFRLANLFRRLVGEGSMNACFIPVLMHYRKDHTESEQWEFIRKFFYTFLILLVSLTVLIIVFSPWLIKAIAPGFDQIPGKTALTIFLNRLMAPYLIFIGLASLFMAILNSHKRFFVPASMPIFFNLSMIFSTLFLTRFFEEPAVAIGIGVLIGGLLQWLLQLPLVKKYGINFKPTLDLYHPQTAQVTKLLIPTLFGIGIVQINLIIDSFFASFLIQGSVSSLYYSDRIMELVLGIFVISLATVTLPELAESARDKNPKKASSIVTMSLRLVAFIAIPATVGLMALDTEIITTLFNYGHFDQEAVKHTSSALFFFAIGLTFISANKVIIPAFFAHKDTKTPVWGAFIALIANIIFIFIFIKPFQVGGIALATSLASIFNLCFLLWKLNKKYFSVSYEELWNSIKKISICALALGIVATITSKGLGFEVTDSVVKRIFTLGSSIILGAGTYFGLSYLLKVEELQELLHFLKRKPDNK